MVMKLAQEKIIHIYRRNASSRNLFIEKKNIFLIKNLISGIKSQRYLLSVGLVVKTTLVSRLP